jgi:DNA-binding transcriptional MerR regulator
MVDDTTADTGADQTPADTAPADKQGKYYTDESLQAMFRERIKEDRASWEKQLGLSEHGLQIKDVKAILAAKKKADDDAKSEVEKLTGERDQHKAEAQQARLESAKLRALVKAGAPADKIDALLKRVVGSTPEEIEADVAELAGLGLLAAKTPQSAQGAGNPGLQDTKEPDLWTQIAEAEKVAIKSGSAEDWKKVNRLKAKAYKF